MNTEDQRRAAYSVGQTHLLIVAASKLASHRDDADGHALKAVLDAAEKTK
jgi:hypothetical protein